MVRKLRIKDGKQCQTTLYHQLQADIPEATLNQAHSVMPVKIPVSPNGQPSQFTIKCSNEVGVLLHHSKLKCFSWIRTGCTEGLRGSANHCKGPTGHLKQSSPTKECKAALHKNSVLDQEVGQKWKKEVAFITLVNLLSLFLRVKTTP